MATEDKRVNQLKDFYKSSETEHRESMERFRENMRFVIGGQQQWDPKALKILKAEGRPAITWNEILPKVMRLFGEFLDSEAQIEAFARRGGVSAGAAILTAMAKHAMDMCKGEFEEAEAFMNGLCGGMGWLHWKRDYSEDPFNGDAVIESRWPSDIMCDESAREYDINKTGKFIFDQWWWDLEELKLAYPKRAADIGPAAMSPSQEEKGDSFFGVQRFWKGNSMDDYGQGDNYDDQSDPENPNIKLRYRTRTCWWKSYAKQPHLLIAERPLEIIKLKGKELLVRAIRQVREDPERFRIIERTACTLHKTVQAGQLIFEDTEDPLGVRITRYPFARFAPYWMGGYWMAVVDNAKDPQRFLNKMISQWLHIINATARTGFFNKKEGGAKKRDLEEEGGKLAPVIEYVDTKPDQIEPPKVPEGHARFAAASSEAIGRIMGVREAMEGSSQKANESGVALYRKQLQGQKIARPMFHRYNQTRVILYTGVTELIRWGDVYSIEEISALIDEDQWLDKEIVAKVQERIGPAPKPPPPPNQAVLEYAASRPEQEYQMLALAAREMFEKAMLKYDEDAETYEKMLMAGAKALMTEQIKSIEFGRYGMKIGAATLSQTIRIAMFQQMIEARKDGVMIPDDMIVEASEWPNKTKIVERIRQNQEQMQAAAVAAG